MQEMKSPIFTKGRILKIEMLERLRDYPIDVTEAIFAGLSDGIITGCYPLIRETELEIQPGLLKKDGRIYCLNEPMTVSYTGSEKDTMLKLEVKSLPAEEDFEAVEFHCFLTDQFTLSADELELARFKLKPGAYLRDDYEDMEDFATVYNTVNLIHRQHAATGGASLCPRVVQYFVRELMKYESQHPHDIALYYQVIDKELAVSGEMLVNYISNRQQQKAMLADNEEIYQELVKIVSRVKGERRTGVQRVARGQRLIID